MEARPEGSLGGTCDDYEGIVLEKIAMPMQTVTSIDGNSKGGDTVLSGEG